ncbi:uncharacterized protein LOC126372216 isoform X3 [Pectinophora gossypiella]|uniref:uncharacterized protein LOC126372216 isoform X3 n=1 Tax=Pectinophora gossypiella TaxID=13191 RepID=UPI00214F3A9D|nr:uncharacterized protein LOC126372216 isoform X3 [Pectinophora gossypiella]
MASDNELFNRRKYVKGTMTRLRNSLTSEFLASASEQMLRTKEEHAHSIFKEYIDLTVQVNDDHDPTPVEEAYFVCMDLLRTTLQSRFGTTAAAAKPSGGSNNVTSKLKLPDIQIPPFDGKYLEYKPFIELFTALVHNDSNIVDIQKFVYLRGFLKGEAFDLINNLPIQGSSYSEALTILRDRYDNSHKIVFEHISKLLDLASIPRPNVTMLRNLISVAKQHVAALKNLNEPVDKWDSILVCILSRKLDPVTNRAYCLDRNSSQSPTFTDFIKYLETRALALENSSNNDVIGARKVQATAAVTNNHVAKCYYCGVAAPA